MEFPPVNKALRRIKVLSIFAIVATLFLITMGGLVHTTDSSLACPDWPLCFDSAFPPMQGAIFYEHGHRLAALLVALSVLGLTILCAALLQGRDKKLAWLAITLLIIQGAAAGLVGMRASKAKLADASVPAEIPWDILLPVGLLGLFAWLIAFKIKRNTKEERKSAAALFLFAVILGNLVEAQAVLGGLTVLLRLPVIVSSAHLATAIIFITLLNRFFLATLNLTAPNQAPLPTKVSKNKLWLGLSIVVFLQIVLGALVRHTASGMACGADLAFFSCVPHPGMHPPIAAAYLMLTHRSLGIVLGVSLFTLGLWQQNRLSIATALLVVLQVGIGFLTVLNYIGFRSASTHLSVGVLLYLCCFWQIYLPIKRKKMTSALAGQAA